MQGSGAVIDLSFPTEKGYGNAVRNDWMKRPGYDVYVVWDNDFATPISYIPFFVRLVMKRRRFYEKADAVIGARSNRLQSGSPLRGIISRTFNHIIKWLFNSHMSEHLGGFRAYSHRLVEMLVPYTTEKHWMWRAEMVLAPIKCGFNVVEVPVSYNTALRKTPLRRLPKDLRDIVPGIIRLLRRWR